MKTLVAACALGLIATTNIATYVQTDYGSPVGTPSHRVPSDKDVGTTAGQFSAALIGTWKSAPDETKLTGDFDKSVWGPNATSVRTLELRVLPSGEGTLRVVKKVVDGKGHVVPASTWIEETQLQLGGATPGVATRLEHQTTVVKAVRRFADDPDDQWPLDGLKVKLVTFQDGDSNTLEVRYDTPEGRGSFWETLRRQRSAPRGAAR